MRKRELIKQFSNQEKNRPQYWLRYDKKHNLKICFCFFSLLFFRKQQKIIIFLSSSSILLCLFFFFFFILPLFSEFTVFWAFQQVIIEANSWYMKVLKSWKGVKNRWRSLVRDLTESLKDHFIFSFFFFLCLPLIFHNVSSNHSKFCHFFRFISFQINKTVFDFFFVS